MYYPVDSKEIENNSKSKNTNKKTYSKKELKSKNVVPVEKKGQFGDIINGLGDIFKNDEDLRNKIAVLDHLRPAPYTLGLNATYLQMSTYADNLCKNTSYIHTVSIALSTCIPLSNDIVQVCCQSDEGSECSLSCPKGMDVVAIDLSVFCFFRCFVRSRTKRAIK